MLLSLLLRYCSRKCDALGMNEVEGKEYLEGKIRGLEMVRDALISSLAKSSGDLPREIELRISVRNGMADAIGDILDKSKVVESLYGQGVRDALLQSKSGIF